MCLPSSIFSPFQPLIMMHPSVMYTHWMQPALLYLLPPTLMPCSTHVAGVPHLADGIRNSPRLKQLHHHILVPICSRKVQGSTAILQQERQWGRSGCPYQVGHVGSSCSNHAAGNSTRHVLLQRTGMPRISRKVLGLPV
jgi:hypothetical protein